MYEKQKVTWNSFFNKGTIPNKKSQQVFLECHGSFEHGGKGVPRGSQEGYVVSYLRVQNYIDFKTKMNIPNLNFLYFVNGYQLHGL